MRLISKFLDAYLPLDPSEFERFRKAMNKSQLTQEQGVGPSEYVTSWEQAGIEKGRQQGVGALRELLADILTTRFGALDASLLAHIQGLDSIEELRRLTHQALTAPSVSDLQM